MKPFLNEDFLLESETAKYLYHNHASKMPIIDYHCHINPEEIANDRRYDNITQVWLGGDHYKWRAMRCNGVAEKDITGSKDTDPYNTFEKWASTLPQAIGNPLYHWTYLELKKYFGITKQLNSKTSKEIFDECNKRLKDEDMSVRGLIKQSNVKVIGTTDDPIDDLKWHKQIANDSTCEVKVVPSYRPDKAMNIDKDGFVDYINKLGEIVGKQLNTVEDVCEALNTRIDYFNDHGSCISDHALDYCIYEERTPQELNAIFKKAMEGNSVTQSEAEAYKTAILVSLAKKYRQLSWVMQIHFGCIRNNNTKMYNQLGPDTGFDAVSNEHGADALAKMLDAFNNNGIPKMVLYSLNQYDNEAIATIAGCFQADAQCPGQIQLGSAWWFNDTKTGMEKQLTDLANLGVLGNFVGMLTDSRSFLSYTRHEYFRRILCNWVGKLAENGEYYNDLETMGKIVEDISYYNTLKFFGFDK